jgi:hypothetical protein
VVEQNVDLLNEVATQRKLPGYEFTHIAVDVNGKGLCLKASQPIPATPWMNKTGLCEYSGTERPVDPQEHVNSIPLRQLMYDANTIEMANSIARAPTKTWIAYLDTCRLPTQGKSHMSPNDS